MKIAKLLKCVIIILSLLCCITRNVSLSYADVKNSREIEDADESDKSNNNSIQGITKESISNFVESYLQTNMKQWKVPGVAVVAVKDQKELYKAGFGVSSIETQQPVDPDKTTFPAASVSKLFTATAIMQLYQEGKIDLDESIQTYLDDIVIINPYNAKVTCQNLLTHSSGLDEQ